MRNFRNPLGFLRLHFSPEDDSQIKLIILVKQNTQM